MNPRRLLRAAWLAAWLGVAGGAWAQADRLASRIEGLSPLEQRQLKALVDAKAQSGGPFLFNADDVRASRAALRPADALIPLARVDIEGLARRLDNVSELLRNMPFRIVSDDPVYPVCPGCAGGLDKTCHSQETTARRAKASDFLTRYPGAAGSVAALYLAQPGGSPVLIGTAFVARGRIVTNLHVLLAQLDSASGLQKLKPGVGIEAVFGRGTGTERRIALPPGGPYLRRPGVDLVSTAWPAGQPAPPGLVLAGDAVALKSPVAVLGFPSVNTNTDLPEDIARVLGSCPGVAQPKERLVIALGAVEAVADGTIEHTANTMGNSSGSPLLRLSDGAVVGVHKGDSNSLKRNSAVALAGLAELLATAPP